jgi:hypothetical protein
VIEDIVKILKEFENIVSVKSLLDLLPKREEEEHVISIVSRVKLY